MRLPDPADATLLDITRRLRELVPPLLADLTPDGPPIALENTADLLENQPATRLFVIQSGQLHCESSGKLTHILEVGDVIGLARSLQLPEGPYRADAPVLLLPYQHDNLLNHVNSTVELQKHWALYLICLASFFRQALVATTPMLFKPATGFLYFEEGEIIISEGEEAECVYTLLEGSADALHGGVKVGEIHAEEIFGAMAVFTKQKRNASVVATSTCSVLAVRKDEFLDLVRFQPQVCLSLVEEMAEKINQLNRQVKGLRSS